MKIISTTGVTYTIAKAMEQADRFKHVVIIAETVDEDECSHVMLASNGTELASLNYMADILKDWIFRQ